MNYIGAKLAGATFKPPALSDGDLQRLAADSLGLLAESERITREVWRGYHGGRLFRCACGAEFATSAGYARHVVRDGGSRCG